MATPRVLRFLLLTCAIALHMTVSSPSASAEVADFGYDALGRLISVTKDDGTVIEYEYDAAGNRRLKEVSDEPGDSGGGGGSATNTPPVAVTDGTSINLAFGVRELNLTANDTDADGDDLTIVSVTQPTNASVAIISASEVRIFAESVGFDMFEYTISDGNGGQATGMVSVYVYSQGGIPH